MESSMSPEETLEYLEKLKNGSERVSGDSRKWKDFSAEPDPSIKSTLDFCNLGQYLDLIVFYTQNKSDVFMTLNIDDLQRIGIENKQHCEEIESAINITMQKRTKLKPVTLNEKEALKIMSNTNENLKNVALGMRIFMKELIKKKPRNFFVSETSEETAAHDALLFIRRTKDVYQHLVTYLHEKEVVSDKEYRMILNKLHRNPSKRNKLKWFAISCTVGSMAALGYLIISRSH